MTFLTNIIQISNHQHIKLLMKTKYNDFIRNPSSSTYPLDKKPCEAMNPSQIAAALPVPRSIRVILTAHSLTTTYVLHIPSRHGPDYWETSLEITTERPGRMKHHTHYPTFAECSPAFLSCCSNSATRAEAADSCSAFLSSCVLILHRISL